MPGLRLNLLAVGLVITLVFLQYRLWFEPGGIRDMVMLRKALVLQERENAKLKKLNETLLFQVQRLQNSQDAVESRARNELGMVKKDETFFQIVK